MYTYRVGLDGTGLAMEVFVYIFVNSFGQIGQKNASSTFLWTYIHRKNILFNSAIFNDFSAFHKNIICQMFGCWLLFLEREG